jgi:hypothetical protein
MRVLSTGGTDRLLRPRPSPLELARVPLQLAVVELALGRAIAFRGAVVQDEHDAGSEVYVLSAESTFLGGIQNKLSPEVLFFPAL